MDFRVLGPLEVRDGDREVPLRGGKERALLALLLVNLNRTLALDRIIDGLWDEEPPETAQKMVQIYVSHLRKVLPADTLRTRPPGYALVLEEQQVDLHRFEAAVAQARAALDAGLAHRAADGFRDALSLWRGPALAEFASEPFARSEGARLEDLRVFALEGQLEAALALGQHHAAVSELEALTARYPLRERLRSQHMLALYRSGRQAEALASYRAFRRTLADELGIEPSAALRELERQMLQQDPALELPAQPEPTAAVGNVAYARSGDVRIAYQVVGDGPVDIILVHGWVCTFQPGWEYPRLAAFYRRLASLGRLVLFDKRGTGLSDRVTLERLPHLEQRMDDVRAVLDSIGSERAVLVGISEGAAMSVLFAATYPERTVALVLMGAFAREMRSPDYPFGVREDDLRRRLALLEEDDWATAAAADWIGRVAPGTLHDAGALRWYTSYLRRGASPGAAKALRLMNAEIDVRDLLPTISVPTLVTHRAHETWSDGSRFLGEHIPSARVVELPGDDHLPWEGDMAAVLDQVERFLSGALEEAEPDRVLATLLLTDVLGPAAKVARVGREWQDLVQTEVARFRGRQVDLAGDRAFATFDGPARAVRCACSIADGAKALDLDVRTGVHTGEVERANGRVRGVAVHIAEQVTAAAAPGEVLVSSTVKDIVAGSGIVFEGRGERELEGALGAWRLFAPRL